MLPVFTMPRPRQMSQVLKWEVAAEFSRESGLLKAGAVVDVGTVVAKLATGQLVPLDPAAQDGTEDIYGVALNAVDAVGSTDDVDGVLIARRLCKVSRAGLLWKAGTTDGQIAAVLADAEARLMMVATA